MKNYTLAMVASLMAATAAQGSEPTALAAAPPAATPSAPVPATVANASQMIAKAAHSLGYKPPQQDGKTVYCKKETKVGTRFETTTCLTEDQVAAAAKRSEGNRDTFEDFQRAFLAGAGSNEPSSPIGSARSQ